jgi:hypothetical protein
VRTSEHKQVSKYYARHEANGWTEEEATRDTSLHKAADASFNVAKCRKNVGVIRDWLLWG